VITLILPFIRRQKMALCAGTLTTALTGMATLADEPLVILVNQPYALCAGAIAFVFDQVAYANCAILFGNSISLRQDYPPVPLTGQPGGNIETVNQQGLASGSFIVSTYSPPASLTNPAGNTAVYTCRPGSKGSFAQCDGGLCFRSTTNRPFPGQGGVSMSQIVCSCPIASHPFVGYEYFGPYPCLSNREQDRLCNASVSNGSTLYIGATIGSAEILAKILNGGISVPLNKCSPTWRQ
jgi:hypothetical protein